MLMMRDGHRRTKSARRFACSERAPPDRPSARPAGLAAASARVLSAGSPRCGRNARRNARRPGGDRRGSTRPRPDRRRAPPAGAPAADRRDSAANGSRTRRPRPHVRVRHLPGQIEPRRQHLQRRMDLRPRQLERRQVPDQAHEGLPVSTSACGRRPGCYRRTGTRTPQGRDQAGAIAAADQQGRGHGRRGRGRHRRRLYTGRPAPRPARYSSRTRSCGIAVVFAPAVVSHH